jgi:hypothetical protein
MNKPDTEPTTPLEPPESVYMLRGGAIYGEPVASDSDVFRTLQWTVGVETVDRQTKADLNGQV